MNVAWSWIWPAVHLKNALLVDGVTASNSNVGGKRSSRRKLQSDPRRDINGGDVPSRHGIAGANQPLRICQEVNFAIQRHAAADESITIISLQGGSAPQVYRVGNRPSILGK